MSELIQQSTPEFGKHLYKLFPHRYRLRDHSSLLCSGESERLKFMERFCRVFGDSYETVRIQYAAFLDWWDPERCPEEILPYLAKNYGWPLDTSLDEDVQRILIKNLNFIYKLAGRRRALWFLIYVHTGINVRIEKPNDDRVMISPFMTRSTNEYTGGGTFTVDDIGPIVEGDRLWQVIGQSISSGVVGSVSGTDIAMKRDFSYPMPSGTRIYQCREYNSHGVSGIGGKNLFIADVTPCGLGVAGQSTDNLMLPADRTALHTFTIIWPSEPDSATLAIANAVIDYCKPARSHYRHQYLSMTPWGFYADHSRTDSRDVAGE